jgi:hypothetical protein
MRTLFAIAILATSLAGIGQAGAADYAIRHSTNGYVAGGVRAPQMLVYDNEPGVYVRAYWSAPWQNRHYYPFTGKKPKVGRLERLSDVRPAPTPAEPFYREWSTISLYPPAVIAPQATEQPLAPLK